MWEKLDDPEQAAEWRPREELQAELERVGSKIESVREHRDGKGYSAYVRDGDGNLLKLNVVER